MTDRESTNLEPRQENDTGWIDSIIDSISWSLDMSTETYLYALVVPSLVLAILFSIIGGLIQPFSIAAINIIIIIFGWFLLAASTVYPYIIRSEQSKDVTENFHFFITYFSALSLASVNRMEVFRETAREESHGYVSNEMQKVVMLVDTWNMSLSESCMIVSKNTPSELLSGFLERLSHNLDSGSSLQQFLKSEQEPIMEKYSARYEADLDRIEIFAESYLSLMIGLTFATVFGMIAPFIADFDPITIIGGLLGAFVMVQILFGLIIQSVSPEDYLWYRGDYRSEISRKKRYAIFSGISLSFLLLVLVSVYVFLASIPIGTFVYVLIWTSTTPCLLFGSYVVLLESNVVSRDNKFSGLIRSLGSSENVKRASTRSVLREILNRDFGSLQEPVRNLYRRFASRAEYETAWSYFAADTSSYLISRFTQMYQIGRELGADTGELGSIISKNSEIVLKLREKRSQTSSTLVGLTYGVIAVASFAFFVTIQVSSSILSFQSELGVSQEFQIINFAGYNPVSIQYLVLVALFITCISSSIIIKLAQRRSLGVSMFHFSLLFLITILSGIAVETVTQYIPVL